MNKQTFISLIDNPSAIDGEIFDNLHELVEQYPYFFTARKLFLKSLFDNNSTSYQPELKLAAIHTGNRSLLQSFINKKTVISQQSDITDQQIKNREEDEFEFLEIDFEKSVTNMDYTFPEITEIEQKTISEKKKQQIDIIEKFIKNEPKIVIRHENGGNNNTDLTAGQNIETELLTETLANIYVKQKYYDKAIAMFQKLSLKFPQKSIYFANRISEINDIVNQVKK